MIKSKRWIPILIGALLLTSGCGSSIFKGLLKNPAGSSSDASALKEQHENRSSTDTNGFKEDKLQAIEKLKDPKLTTEDKKAVNVVLGESILAEKGVTAIDIGTKLADLSTSSNKTASENAKNAFSLLRDSLSDKVTSSDLRQAAKAFDNATASDNTKSDAQLQKGVTNALLIVDKVNTVFTVKDDGGVDLKNGQTVKDSLSKVLERDPSGNSIVDYASHANDGFQNSLNGDSKDQAEKLTTKTQQIQDLQKAATGIGPSFVDPGDSSNVITSLSSDEAIQNALNHIINK